MSYDVEVATHDQPDEIEVPDGVTVDGPFAAEPDDLAEPLAAAVLAPRWLTTVSAGNADAARKVGRRLAKLNEGAAYDPQEDAVFYPRGRPKRVPAAKPEKTSIVRLEWYVPAERWAAAPGELVATLARRCPEALPTRYGDIEPLQERYDPEQPDTFGEFIASSDDEWTFWFSSRPSFGGHARAPQKQGPGHLGLDLDWRVLDADPRWREAIAGLFASVADAVGALYAEGWVEPGWRVSRNNRLSTTPGRKTRGTPLYRGRFTGLPAEPAWLTWFGGEYHEPVAAALDGVGRLRKGLVRKPVTPAVTPHDGGLCVRLGEQPLAKLPALPLPAELLRPLG